MVPVELIDRNDIGDLCAWMTLATDKDLVEKSNTSPDCCTGEDACAAGCVRDVGEGTGEGYARNELSAEGERAAIAVGFRMRATQTSCM